MALVVLRSGGCDSRFGQRWSTCGRGHDRARSANLIWPWSESIKATSNKRNDVMELSSIPFDLRGSFCL
jgi:hypothetical protein